MARSEKWIKWLFFGGLVLLVLLGQELLLRNLRLWGVAIFILPMIPAIISSFEGPQEGTVFALVFGALCDLTVVSPIPCFFTLTMVPAALFSALIAQSWLQPGLICSALCSALSYLICDALYALIFLFKGDATLVALLLRGGQELIINLPFVIPLHFIFLPWHKKCHIYD